tara:strand:+ start:1688 stop:1963 length:276 start_codon:yes stop_codon:yes gene_type:complete
MIKIIALGVVALIGLYVVWMMIAAKEVKDVHINATYYKLKKDKAHGNDTRRKDKNNSRGTGPAQQSSRKPRKATKHNSGVSRNNSGTSTKN